MWSLHASSGLSDTHTDTSANAFAHNHTNSRSIIRSNIRSIGNSNGCTNSLAYSGPNKVSHCPTDNSTDGFPECEAHGTTYKGADSGADRATHRATYK
jgi:hypothetical protein